MRDLLLIPIALLALAAVLNTSTDRLQNDRIDIVNARVDDLECGP